MYDKVCFLLSLILKDKGKRVLIHRINPTSNVTEKGKTVLTEVGFIFYKEKENKKQKKRKKKEWMGY